jgi:tRNA(Ile)-lysidine synthase
LKLLSILFVNNRNTCVFNIQDVKKDHDFKEECEMLEDKVGAFLERHSFSLKGKKIVAGVSGGPDSLAMLHYLQGQREKQQLSIIVAHVDHMFRGEESYQDALFVKDYCEDLLIPFEMEQINVPELMKQTGKSAEVAGREARYEFFAKVMKESEYPYLALAHHGDDQIETILMRFTRGSTGKARAGIPFQRPFNNGTIFRPFLALTKKEIEEYCEHFHLVPRIDPSNKEDIYSRNRFRRVVLPFLKTENRHVHEHFQRFSEETQSDEAYLQELTINQMNTVITTQDEQQIAMDINQLLEMPMPLQRRGIQLILNYLYKERPASLSAVHIDQVFSLINRQHPSGTLDFPGGLKVTRSYRNCYFQFNTGKPQSYYFELIEPGIIKIPGVGMIKMEFTELPLPDLSRSSAIFDRDFVPLPLTIRTRKPGDRMTLKGMPGTKKVKDIFIDHKIPLPERDNWPVVTDMDNSILWLPGLKKSAVEGIGEKAGSYIQLTYYKH